MPEEIINVKEFLQHAFFVQDFIFPDIEKLQIFTITKSTTQKKLSQKLISFVQKTYYKEILLLVVNVEDVSLDEINHVRIMIEEFEIVPKQLHPKLFVLLLHFPPQYSFDHFYSSYFLHGWDHYYLDSVGQESTSTSINIKKWFSQCCAELDTTVALGSFMETEYFHNLLSEALPLITSHISLEECELADSRRPKLKCLTELVFVRGLDKIIFSRFSSYWTPSVMVAITEQASNLACLQRSTLSITDAVNTIIKSYFYDFLLYILSLMNGCQAIMIVIRSTPVVVNSDVRSPIEELVLRVVSQYPLPKNLTELRIQMVQTDKLFVRRQPRLEFPFFHFVYSKIEKLLNQLQKEIAAQSVPFDDEEQPENSTDMIATQETLVDRLETLLRNKVSQCLSIQLNMYLVLHVG